MHTWRTAAAIIGGGQASRFGGIDKSGLVINGQTIIQRQAAAVQPLVSELFIVASQRDRYAHLPWRVVPDAHPGTGVVGAIATALAGSDADAVLCLACDLPFVTTPLLAALDALAASDDADGAWVRTDRGAEPLLACYRSSARPAIEAALAAGRRRGQELGQVLRMAELSGTALAAIGDPARLTANINSATDFERLQILKQ